MRSCVVGEAGQYVRASRPPLLLFPDGGGCACSSRHQGAASRGQPPHGPASSGSGPAGRGCNESGRGCRILREIESGCVEYLDLQLIHALQIDGRAPLRRIASVLGVSD
ncbi:AsnC family protein, partial [Streptomyces celluloflavus]|uniref:AsnC family protein n=1 Tax=Streptomyces celluloflavus TaxID=58344 RepID=UPI0036BE3279